VPKNPATGWANGPLSLVESLAERTLRLVFKGFIRLIYRVRVVGRHNVPKTGPALLVCNHVSWLDALLILLSLRRRVRFLVWAPFTKVPGLRVLLRLARAIPIDSSGGPRQIVAALKEAGESLARGDLVGIFAEGSITRTGFILPFQRGFEQILKKTAVPIVPACLDRLWGSIFSYQGGRLLWKRPQKIPYPVTVAFGAPLPPESRAWQVRQAVQVLLADCFNLRKKEHKPLQRQFVRMACRHPRRPCLVDPLPQGKRLTYGETLTAAVLLSRRLRERLDDQPMTGLLLPTTLGSALANIAVSLLGKTAVNLNYTASKESIQSAIAQCNIRHVISSRAFRERIKPDLGAGVRVIDLEDLPPTVGKVERVLTYVRILLQPGWVTEHWMLGLGRHTSGDLATVIFSSGSTGDPKGVMLSHHNIVSNIESVSQAIDLSPKERLLAVLPFFHSFGYTGCLWLPLLLGASVVLYPDPRQAKEIGEFCRRFKCNLFISTPTFLRFLIRRCDPGDFKTLRMLITGAEKLPRTVADEFEKKFGVEPLEGYGCTELSPVVSVNVQDVEVDGVRQIGHKRGTIGQPLPGIAVRVVHPETFAPLPPGEEGLLLAYGPNVMVGYLNRPEATREVIKDGWYVTGDVAKIDEDGFITITDRLSRFSKVAGEMVPHQRVEEAIHSVLNTTERVCAVTGVPDEKKGERLVVLHTPLNGLSVQQMHQRLAASGLPNLWLPGPRSYFEVPELPVLGSGKLDLQKVKKLAVEFAAKSAE
jgi:acyl-[acyl-carrier-protein]-phospholipid O-acyltransferase/long-chain-fatty-acid--[acyl-carrier-protein] ligase